MATQGIKFLYEFSVGAYDTVTPGANVISVTSTAAGDHNKKNLTTTPLRETWRSTDASTQEIVLQANDTDVIPNVFALLNHNLSENAIVHLYGNNSNSWATPTFSTTILWNKKHMCYVADIGTAFQYYKVKIQDAGNPCGYIEVGKIVAGLSFTLSVNEDMADDFGIKTEDLAYRMQTEGFFRASNERVKIQTMTLQFPKLQTVPGSDTNYQGLLELADEVGETFPFLTIVDPSDPYFRVLWGQFSKIPTESYTTNRYVSLSCEIEEVF